jgi:hypothetical protein
MDVRPGQIVQIAYAVDDVHRAAARFAHHHGAGPFVVSEHIAVQPERDGDVLDHSSAYGQWGAVQVELVHVHAARPAALADALVRPGGVHHVAWFTAPGSVGSDGVDGFAFEQQRLHERGWPCVFAARAGEVRFAFHDARAELGHLVEIYEPHPRLLAFYDHVAALAARGGADGGQPSSGAR